MSSGGDAKAVIDVVAQAIQALRQDRPLLRIDNLADAETAPFQFDAARGRLHRRGCRSIPARSRQALYGVWRIGPEERTLACTRCKPEPMDKPPDKGNDAADMLFGLISLIDQFGGVLRERGQEYRRSDDGRQLSKRFEGVFQGLDRREQDFLSTLLTSMDGLIKSVRDLDDRLNKDRANGHDPQAEQAQQNEPTDEA